MQRGKDGPIESSYLAMHRILWTQRLGVEMPRREQGEVKAVINHGRWIVECPGRCGGAVAASMESPIFACSICGGPENDGRAYRVVFPQFWEALEAALVKRPPGASSSAENRNWRPEESLAAIKRENVEHGVPA